MGEDKLIMAREIINPRWGNEEKTHIIAGFKYDDGRVLTASITNAPCKTTANPYWLPSGGDTPSDSKVLVNQFTQIGTMTHKVRTKTERSEGRSP